MNNQHPMFYSPMFYSPMVESKTSSPDNETPARVRIALEFLSQLTAKTMTRAYASEHEIAEVEGQKLTGEEEQARKMACIMLNQYFAGNLKLDFWEQQRAECFNKTQGGGVRTVINCPACLAGAAAPSKDCALCGGRGRVVVIPTNNMTLQGGDNEEDE